MTFAFAGMLLDEQRRELIRDGAVVSMEPQVFDVLAYLLKHRDQVVTKEELMDAVWGGRFVSETAVSTRIKQVRRVLGDDGRVQAFVRTYHGRGYRFVADVSASATPTPARPAQDPGTSPASPVLFAEREGVRLAFQLTGQGPPDIVLLEGPVSDLELDWTHPGHARLLHGLGKMGRLIRFDRRGSGRSDRSAPPPDVETQLQDLLAVLDAAACERAVVLGASTGGAAAILLAATHPERVAGLVLFASYARRTRTEDYPHGEVLETRRAALDDLVARGGWEGAAAAVDADLTWWRTRAKAAVSPAVLREVLELDLLTDVRDVLAAVRVPVLVLHRAGDDVVPVGAGRYLAAHLADAEFVELPGAQHWISSDADQVLDVVEEFVETAATAQAPERSLSALVGLAQGDVQALADVLVAQGGALRQGPERSQLVSFDGPATALRALASRRTRGLLTGVGVGLAIDEVSRTSPYVSGHGVDVARLLALHAAPGEVLLPNVIKDLLAGSGLSVRSYGELDLPHVGPHAVHIWVRE